jgi:hypothetical protein
VYLFGSIWVLANWTGTSANSISLTDPEFIPFYTVLAGGPVVLLLGLLHAALPGLSSLIIGEISVFPSSMFVVCTGIVSADSVWSIILYRGNHATATVDSTVPHDHQLHPAAVILLIGTLLLGLSWLAVMICSLFYNYQSENWTQVPRHDQIQSRIIPFGPGRARVVSVPAIIISVICWIVIVIQLPVGTWFPFDGVILIGPLFYLAVFLHAGCVGGASTVSGVFASILSVMYMAFLGTTLSTADYACSVYSCGSIDTIKDGGIFELVSVSCILCLWPFYMHYPSSRTTSQSGGTTQTAEEASVHQLESTRRAPPGYETSLSQRDYHPLINY